MYIRESTDPNRQHSHTTAGVFAAPAMFGCLCAAPAAAEPALAYVTVFDAAAQQAEISYQTAVIKHIC